MANKIPWSSLYSAFRQKFPNWRSQVLHWEPYDFMKILIECKNGRYLIYDHSSGVITIVSKYFIEGERQTWRDNSQLDAKSGQLHQ